MSQTRILLVRHAKTQWNLESKLQGWKDSKLSASGKRHFQNVDFSRAVHLAKTEHQPSHPPIYCSDLGRALSSARIIANQVNGYLIPNDNVRERRFGELEGKQVTNQVYWDCYHRRFDQPFGNKYGAESDSDFESRIASFLNTLIKRHPFETVWVVSHGEWIRTALNLAHGRKGWEIGEGIPENGQITLLDMKSIK
ncbi:histidine phosphatase family protein [Vibrio tapetis]|uniref:Putative Phosphoglycerate mutase n=1 Tax=Vibrio tapetis subsp. tapetis TaxID=1671868 RepID=A0A2N8ZMG1_9VIBR|nr:histidine phosphatase family protein [Vibrio tapetis]SON53057.1 putative Phosphoglycerate mutase [Vibrio tapetis subsp. tapetis]